MLNRRQFLLQASAFTALANGTGAQTAVQNPGAQPGLKIRHVDIVHHVHTDVGYTALPSVVRDNQIRYINAAIDACQADRNFRWTIEALLELDDWWKASSAVRHGQLLSLVKAGQIDVMGMAFNQTPLMNAMQWRQMMQWIPAALWQSLNIRAAMQNDVNGMPRAGAMALLDRGVKFFLMGINVSHGGPPFRRPSAFWWKMPDGRRMFVWLGDHYGRAHVYLGAAREGTRFRADEASVRAAHAGFVQRLQTIESDGYTYDRLILTFTNPLAADNGTPYPSVAPFVAAYNKLGLQPSLRLTTATVAVADMEKAVGSGIPTMEGEWTDWWANGSASGPQEISASRVAKRNMAAAMSPIFGPMPQKAARGVEEILKDLCLFDEHTWGSSVSITAPYDLGTLGEYVEKSDLAYKPMGASEALLSRRVRAIVDPLPEGVYVINPAPVEISGWASVSGLLLAPAAGAPAGAGGQGRTAAAGPPVGSLVDVRTGERVELMREGRAARFWLEKLPANSIRGFRTDTQAATTPASDAKPQVRLDGEGWPQSASWPGMRKPLFDGSLGHFLCAGVVPPATRNTITNYHQNPDAAQREQIRKTIIRETAATYGAVTPQETPHTLVYVQEIRHERIEQARRTLELWKREPRARVTVRFDRLSSLAPEVFFLDFTMPDGVPLPVVSSGGVPFTPYRDQLPGSCKDYLGIDGWAHYPTNDGHWLWVTRDAPLVAVGSPHVIERHQAEPADHRRILAMVFDNTWHTNFVANSHGTMEFQFDLVWKENIAKPADLAEGLTAQTVALMNPAVHETPALLNNIFRP